jgi:hypothetical protein
MFEDSLPCDMDGVGQVAAVVGQSTRIAVSDSFSAYISNTEAFQSFRAQVRN